MTTTPANRPDKPLPKKVALPQRSALDIAIRQEQATYDYLLSTLEGKLKWVEADIRQIRRDAGRGSFFHGTNMIKATADVELLVARLGASKDALANLKIIKEEEDSK